LNPKLTSTHVEQLVRAIKEFDFNPKGGDMYVSTIAVEESNKTVNKI
jgi:hypothetical protein